MLRTTIDFLGHPWIEGRLLSRTSLQVSRHEERLYRIMLRAWDWCLAHHIALEAQAMARAEAARTEGWGATRSAPGGRLALKSMDVDRERFLNHPSDVITRVV